MANSHTLYFDSGDEVVQAQCSELCHFNFCIKALTIEGTRHSLAVASKVLKRRDNSRIYFHPKGHKFKACGCGYRREETEGRLRLVSMDSRLCWTPDDFYAVINREPFDTPMLPEWSSVLYTAMQGVYIKPLTGIEASGEYLDPALTPAKLDGVVKGLVRRKVITF